MNKLTSKTISESKSVKFLFSVLLFCLLIYNLLEKKSTQYVKNWKKRFKNESNYSRKKEKCNYFVLPIEFSPY